MVGSIMGWGRLFFRKGEVRGDWRRDVYWKFNKMCECDIHVAVVDWTMRALLS